LEVTRKAVERHAEAIGNDVASREQAESSALYNSIFPMWLEATLVCSISKWTVPAYRSRRRRPKAVRVRTETNRRTRAK
jgi:hypothetical protein